MLNMGIVGWGEGRDDLFNPQSPRNRDDCLEPFRVLRAQAQTRNIQLHTIDVLHEKGLSPDFNLYIESLPLMPIEGCKNYLVRFETELTVPINSDPAYLNQFDGIFTWDQELLNPNSKDLLQLQTVSIPKFPICYPNVLPSPFKPNEVANPGFAGRDITCVLIGSNRHANAVDSRELYSERVKLIRWFEAHAPKDFALFGSGWTVPQKRLGRLGKLQYRLEKIIPFLLGKAVFPSYKGPAKTKFEVLAKSRFSICFENARDMRGYLTEKIFDCLFAGCVPIYYGDPDIQNTIPKACFIDFRGFLDLPDPYSALYSYISGMTESQYLEYQNAGRDFLVSPAFAAYTSLAFAESILGPIQS